MSRKKNRKNRRKQNLKRKNMSYVADAVKKYPVGTPVYCKNHTDEERVGVIVEHKTDYIFKLHTGEEIYTYTIKGDLTNFSFDAAKTANFSTKITELIKESRKMSQDLKAGLIEL